ncbi:nidogen-like domain-containing protein [Spirillospora sp. CA-294931]|uniref:nidogen-like domain-containing protein n=1 Tax=Spirillospora sp. CA-294931 TaxID=3240042 RepID=UPI003D8F887C
MSIRSPLVAVVVAMAVGLSANVAVAAPAAAQPGKAPAAEQPGTAQAAAQPGTAQAAAQPGTAQAAAQPGTAPAAAQPGKPQKSVQAQVGTGGLTVVAPRLTDRGSAVLRGVTYAKGRVRVEGGVLPVTVSSDQKGRYSAEVLLRPNANNKLKVSAYQGRRVISKKIAVQQKLKNPKGRVSGEVFDISTRKAIAGATVRYGWRTAKADRDGRFTLTGLPEGGVAVSAYSAGRLSGAQATQVKRGQGKTGRILLQTLARPVSVSPKGGTYSGHGWKVQVPAGAVAKPTNVNLTRLLMTGAKDEFGLPVVDASPNGLRFARPITVTVDPGLIGLVPAHTRFVGVDPDTLTTFPLKTRVVGKQVQFQLTQLRGMEIRVEIPPDPSNMWGGPSSFCKPFTTYNDARNAQQYLHDILLPALRAKVGETSHYLWSKYLTPGVPAPSREDITNPDALRSFDEHPTTVVMRSNTIIRARGRVLSGYAPKLARPETPTRKMLSDFPDLDGKPMGVNVDIEYGDDSYALPVNIAGGVSETHMPGQGVFQDRRDFIGDLTFIPYVNIKGVLTRVDMKANVRLALEDGVDFCPGEIGENFVKNFTVPLSRLEKTPYFGAGTWAKPVIYKLKTGKPKTITHDVTDAYNNDEDQDSVPNYPPWEGASFKLDNCKETYNPDQADRDGNGKGDACEPCPPNRIQAAADKCERPPGGNAGGAPRPDGTPRPDTGPSKPGTGGSYGDPHFITFDGGAVDFQGAGDYVLAQSAAGDFAVQGRYVRLPGRSSTMSINRGVAAKVGKSVIAFGDDTTSEPMAPQVATLDGKRIALKPGMSQKLPGGAVLTYGYVRGAVVRWADGTELAAGRWIADNAFITLAPSRFGKVRGLLGNADRNPANDLTARNGTRVTDPLNLQQLYGSFGASWQATGKASLFRTKIPPGGALPVRPPKVASVADLSPAARADAERVCREMGVAPGAALQQCILDVGLTGDRTFAGNAAVVADRLRSSVDLAALTGRVETTATLPLNQNVQGRLDKAYVTDVFQFNLTAGQNLKVTTPGPCTGSGTFSITLVAPSGRAIDRTRGAGCGTLEATGLRESGRYQLRVHDTGGFTGPYTLRADTQQAQAVCQGDKVAPSDDELSPKVNLAFPINFKGRQFNALWVNNNGNVTFDDAFSDYTPKPFEGVRSPIIAALWADTDTRKPGSGQVRYGNGTVQGRRAFCVDYDKVGYYNQNTDKLNTYQLYIVDRADVAPGAFDIVYHYKTLKWETGDASSGNSGLGGTSAGAGYSNGTGNPGTFHEVNGSRRPGTFLDTSPTGLAKTSTNSNQPGMHVFPIRN